ncbi:MAG TPA: hypothetical protein DCY91_29060 [Cyanobacteria bacterium UBA11370]|nr:hypothetical protein [Cyanobacteria bacterium UBA11370]
MTGSWRCWRLELATALSVGCAIALTPNPILAQITPDRTLGNENSVIKNNSNIRGLPADLIEGGAVRGIHLFHSFSDFNIKDGQRVYFANPTGIETIFSRITGNNLSNILGTLGVNGGANLFLLNPNGIIFGPNAKLDIAGSFVASTANSFKFGNSLEFSATNPQAPPLLNINVTPGLQYGANDPRSTIRNTGNLTVGNDLILSGGNLNVQGQLRAGRNLTLQAQDTVQIRDSLARPFIAAAGGELLVEGKQRVDIFALNHPQSGLFSQGDMVLRSANTIGGDAHYWSRGNFRIERLNGNLGNFLSITDPVIRSLGNVSFDSYQGPSLHIFAAGKVEIPGSIRIEEPDPVNGLVERVSLSNGTPISINGRNQATLDIRAGMKPSAVGSPPVTGGSDGNFFDSSSNPLEPADTIANSATRADIKIGNIVVFDSTTGEGGRVLLTNQYQPNSSLSGRITVGGIDTSNDLSGGEVAIDSRGSLTLNRPILANASFIDGNGGDITLIAQGNITLNPSGSAFTKDNPFISSQGLLGGTITLKSDRAILGRNAPIISFSFANVPGSRGGDVEIEGSSFESRGMSVITSTFGRADAGNITINASDSISLQTTQDAGSEIVSVVEPGATGQGGNITIKTDALSLNDRFLDDDNTSNIVTVTQGTGDAGNVNINARDVSFLNGSVAASLVVSVPDSNPATGDGGQLNITTDSLTVTHGSQLTVNTFGEGDAGDMKIVADSITFDGFSNELGVSGAFSGSVLGGTGDGGDIEIVTGSLAVTNGAQISANTDSNGDAGDITINARDSVLFEGVGLEGFSGGAFSQVLKGGEGQGGNINITTSLLEVANNAQISASTEGVGRAGDINISTDRLKVTNSEINAATLAQGNAGMITLNISDSMTLSGEKSGVFASTSGSEDGNRSSTGDGGGISILNPITVVIQNGAAVAVNSKGSGMGGDIEINADSVTLDQDAKISAETASSTGGDITLRVPDVVVLRQRSQISTTAGTDDAGGNGGNITINTGFIAAVSEENSDITANAFEGRGGNINITAQGVFGIDFRDRLTPLSDITASSELGIDGVVQINTPNVDPSRGLVTLPANLVDASRLVAQGCRAGGGNIANKLGEFFITGRGGLPPSPGETLSSQAVWQDLRPVATPIAHDDTEAAGYEESAPKQIVEAQGWVKSPDGQVILTAEAPNVTPHASSLTSVTCH